MATIGSLIVDLIARTGGFETDLGRASKAAERRAREIEANFRKMGAAIGVGLAAGATAATVAIKAAIDSADELSKTAQRIGVTTEALSQLSYAARLSDVSLQQLQGGLVQLINRQGDAAQGMAEYARVFDTLGISVKNADGTLRDTTEVLGDVADVFASLEDGADKTKLAVELFGRAGAQLIPLLNQGRAGLGQMADEAERLGIVIDTETGKRAEEFNDNLTRLGASLQGVAITVASELLPDLVALSDTVSSPEFREGFASIAEGAVRAVAAVAELTAELGNFARFVGEEVSARVNGPAADDIVRIEQAIERLQAQRDLVLFDVGGGGARLDAEIARLKEQLAAAQKAADEFAIAQSRVGQSADDAADSTEDQSNATGDLISRIRTLFADQGAAARGAKEIARANAEAEKAAEKHARAQRELRERFAEARAEFVDYLDALRAASGGPLAEATLEYSNALDDLQEKVFEGIATQEEAAEVAALLAERLREVGRSAQDEAVDGVLRLWDEMEGWSDDVQRIADEIDGIFSNLFDRAFDEIGQGEEAWAAFSRSAIRAVSEALPAFKKLVDETGEFSIAVEELGAELLPQLGQIAGAVVGGGGEGAQLGASIGGAIGAYFGPVGAIVGAILGGALGGTFDDSPKPRLRVATVNEGIDDPGARGRSVFGTIFVNKDDIEDPTFDDQIVRAIQDFDFAINRLLDESQSQAVIEQLSNFRFDSAGGPVDSDEVLRARFEAILGAFGDQVSSFVQSFGNDLQSQVQAFSDVLILQDLEERGDLLTGSLERTLEVIAEFNQAGETVGQTYQRLTEAALAYANVVATVQEELLTADLSDFQQAMLEIRRTEIQRIRALEDTARATGDLAAREEDLQAVRDAAQARINALIRELQLSATDTAAQLYGRTIADIDEELERIRAEQAGTADAANDAATAIQSVGGALNEVSNIARDVANALVGDFSPLRGMELADFALGALSRGEISLDQALRAGRDVFASGSDFNDFFDQALEAARAGVNRAAPQPVVIVDEPQAPTEPVISPEEQALLDERERLIAEQEARERFALASELAQNLADLASAQGFTFEQVAESLGFTLDQLAADLGLSIDELPEYLTGLQANTDELAQILEDLPENIARSLLEALEAAEIDLVDPYTPDDGNNGGGGGDNGPPIFQEPKVEEDIERTANEAVVQSELLREIRDRLNRLDAIQQNTGVIAEETRQVRLDGFTQELRADSERPRSLPRRGVPVYG